MINMDLLIAEAAKKLEVREDELQWWAWPQVFGNTAGPRGGVGGQMMTTFQVIGFEAENGKRAKWCSGIWRKWDGKQRW